MKQSPIRKLRRDRSRLVQELALAQGTGDTAGVAAIEKRIRELDKDISAQEVRTTRTGGTHT